MKRHFNQEYIYILMVNKHMKILSTTLSIREIPIKIIMRYTYTLISMAKTKNSDNTKCWQRCRENESFVCCWQKWKMYNCLVFYNTKHATILQSSNCPLGHLSPNLYKNVHTNFICNSQKVETNPVVFNNEWLY